MSAEEIKTNNEGVDNAGENENVPVAEEISAEAKPEANETGVEDIVKELNDKYLRLYAEFENYKRRTNKERLDLIRTANEETIVLLLPVMDDFERALKAISTTNDNEAVLEGVNLIYNKLKNILEQKHVKAIDSIGKPFDIDFHEAITKVPAPDPDLKGKVVDEIEKGYMLNDKVIRFAKVVVGE